MSKTITLVVLMVVSLTGWSQRPFAEEINTFKQQDLKNPPPTGVTLFVGSSSIRLWKTLAQDFPKHQVLNRGFGGSTLVDLYGYLDDIVIPYQPKQIVIYCGENDIAAGASAQQTLKRFKKNFRRIRQELPDVALVFISIKPSPSRSQYLTEVKVANRLIKAYLQSYPNTVYVDVLGKMMNAEGNPMPDIFVEDRLHMNAKGYHIWADLIRPILH